MDIRINTIYLIDAKDLESKQCRCKIETMGKLPDDQRSRKGRDVTRGKPRNRWDLGLRRTVNGLTALDDLKLVLAIWSRLQANEIESTDLALPKRRKG